MIDLDKVKENRTTKELLEFGIINLDKPCGPTSSEVVNKVKEKLKLSKAGHFGTLDPAVSGVLPISLNRACKIMDYFLKKNKEYVGVMQVHSEIEEDKLKEEVNKFIGKIMQLPPVRSHVKREEREREVYSFEILEINGKEVLFKVGCEAGTYIRKLIHDLGLKIGGAHMTELRRIKAGIFSEEGKEFVNLYELEKAAKEYLNGKDKNLRKIIIPGEVIGNILPQVYVKEEAILSLLKGKPIFHTDLAKKERFEEGEKVAIFFENRFIEVANVVKNDKIFAKPEFVLN